jgi:hypothetical protein
MDPERFSVDLEWAQRKAASGSDVWLARWRHEGAFACYVIDPRTLVDIGGESMDKFTFEPMPPSLGPFAGWKS